MSALGAARDALATLLVQAVDNLSDPKRPGVLTYVPEGLVTPAIVIQPAEEYVIADPDSATYAAAEWIVQEDVYLVVDLADNQGAAVDLDRLLEPVLKAVRPSDWWLVSMSQPGPVETTEWLAHGLRITLATHINL